MQFTLRKEKRMKKKILFPILLAAMAFPLCLHSEPVGLNAEFIGKYDSDSAYKAYGSDLNSRIADEGFVLLKNDGFLPMQPGKATLAGKSAFNLAKGGAGSGSSSASSGVKDYDLQMALEEVGFEVNTTLKEFYRRKNSRGQWENNPASGIGRTNGNDGWKGNSQVQIGETPVNLYTEDLIASMDEFNDVAIQVITREGSEGCDVKAIDARDFDPRANGTNVEATPLDEITDKHALELSDNEEDLLHLLEEHFDNVIIVINSSNIFECDVFEKDPKVSAVLWIGNPGDVGPAAVGRILVGDVNPSGRTVDTWARDFKLDPTYQNFSDNAQTNDQIIKANDNSWFGKTETYAPQDTMFTPDGDPVMSFGTDKAYSKHESPRWVDEEAKVVQGGINGVKPSAYVSYEEGIYVDYRYYETRYADMAAKNKKAADKWYNGQDKEKGGVVYPFGYGLSYTSFDQQIMRVSPAKDAILDENSDLIEVTVKVTNTGTVAGKDAVQLYWKAPYKKGEIEKADHVLCAFDKSELIQPGQSQIMNLTFHLQDVANYDFSDANGNGFKGYELDPGAYEILLGKNAHEFYGQVTLNVTENGIKYENDRFTGNKVENRFTDRGFYNSLPGEDDIEFEQMSRVDLVKTFPHHPTFESRTVKEGSRAEEFLTHEYKLGEVDVDHNFEYTPEAAYKTEQDAIDGKWEQKTPSPRTQLSAMKGVDLDDPKWESFVNEFSYSEMLNYIESNGMASPGLSAIGKNSFSEGDGPQKFSIMQWVSSPIIAATFNPRLAHEQGEAVGMESQINGKSGWWGPAVNTHRSPFGGRNFEYYSADPFLMGRIAAEVVGAATDRGVYAYFKHFATNDQEKNRESGISYLTEQALREIYLRSFQMVFEEGKSMGVMGSYNRLGLMETAASYPLLTEVLREEWGFKGAVLSDMTHSGNGSVNFKCYENVNNRAIAGCNSQLDQRGFGGNSECEWSSSAFGGKGAPVSKQAYNGSKFTSYTWWYACRQRIKEIMYMSINCTGQNRGLTKVVDVQNVSKKLGEEFTLNVLPSQYESYTPRLNQRCSLPEGVELENGALSGKLEHLGLYRIDLILESGSNKVAVQFIIDIVPAEEELSEEVMEEFVYPKAKGGCGGSLASVGATLGLLALVGVGFILLSLRKKERA